jgi:U6 snRNA-associated Sm-like protein LSm2
MLKPETTLLESQNTTTIASNELPHFKACNELFIRGNVIRYVHLLKNEVDTEPLTDTCRKESQKDKTKPH